MRIQLKPRYIPYAAGLLLSLAAALWFFWQPATALLAYGSAKAYCHFCLDAAFNAEDVRWKDGGLVFTRPSLRSLGATDPWMRAHAAELRIAFHPAPFEGRIAIDALFSSPLIEVSTPEKESARPFHFSTEGGDPKVNTRITFDDGLLVFRDPSTLHESRLAFRGSGDGREGSYTLTSQNQGNIVCSYEGYAWEISCDRLDLGDAHHALKVLGIGGMPATIHQGTLKGEVNIDWDEEDLPNIYGTLQVRECVFDSRAGDLHGYVPEASLVLNDTSFAGELTVGKGAYLEYFQEGRAPISLANLEGSLSLPAYDRCFVQASGICTHHGNTYALHVGGHVQVPAQEKATCELEVVLANDSMEPVRACVSSCREGCGHSQCTLDVKNIGAGEWDLLMAALGTQDIGLEPYTLRDGLIDARIRLGLENFKVNKIDIEQFIAKHVAFDLDQSEVSVKIDSAEGSLSLDLTAPNILETLQASFSIDGGMMRFPALNNQKWQLSNVVTELAIQNGAFKKSFIEADFMGMRGLIEVDWASNKAVILQFRGMVRDLAALASSNVQRGILKKFPDDTLSISADVWRIKNGFNVEGLIEIAATGQPAADAIQVGFILEKTAGNRLLSPSAVLFTTRLGADIIEALVKQMVKPKDEPAAEWLKEELRIAGLALKNGWFNAPQLPTEKYIQPFFFKDDQMGISGNADFQGRFDCDGLAVEYQGEGITLENDDLAFQMGTIGLNQPARHYFDFLNDTDQGVVPVTKGSYFEKNSGLLFVDVEGSMLLKDKTIHIPAIETKCNNVYFAGTIDLDYSSPQKKVFDVDIETSAMEGTYSDVRDLLSHFDQTASLIELPLEGQISLRAPGGAMRFAFRPTGCQVTAAIHGLMQEGHLDTPIDGLAFRNISFEFDYVHEAHQMNIKRIAGELQARDTPEAALAMADGYIHLLDIETGLAEFDLPFTHGSKEIFRLAGATDIRHPEEGEPLLQLLVNKDISHYGGAHPDKVEVLIRPDAQLETAVLQWNCDLGPCFADMQRAGAAAIAAYAPNLIRQWNGLEAPTGNVALNVKYDNPNKQLNLLIEGRDIAVGESTFKHIVFAAAKKRNVWSIEQLQMDKISVAADIQPERDGYQVNFLGLRYGDLLLMGLSGFYDQSKAIFDGSVNLFELDFGRLGQWKSFKELVSDYRPQGEMKGTGSLRVILDDEWPPQVEVKLTGMLRNCQLRGLHFEDADNVTCEYVLRDNLVLRDFQSGFRCADSGSIQGLFGVDSASYNFKKEELSLGGLHFHAHADSLDWVATHLGEVFPEAITPKVATIIRHIKEDDAFHCNMDLRISDEESHVSMRLPQGKYRLGTKEHEVNNFALEWDKASMEVVTQYRFQNTLYWMTVRSTSPEIDAGDIFVSAYPPEERHPLTPADCLCISWYMHPQHGMIVEKASGTLPGVSLNLTRDRQYPMNPHSWHLDGDIVLDPMVGSHIIPPDIVEALDSWKISRNYNLSGKWIFMLEAPHDGDLYFRGRLTGKDVILKGYAVGEVSADLNCSPSQVDIQGLVFQDQCGRLKIDAASMVKQEGDEWWVYIPRVEGENFRPSLLREVDAPPGPNKPLVISEFQIEDIVCRANDLSTMTGSGRLTFNNSSKRPLHNPLLAIPAEIISRIGLNLDVLNPVSGAIYFTIDNYRVVLTKFKDVYSEGKLSKFYLPHTNYSSYVDLDGNVHVQVRMKQYNLLFKLAELFTVTIHGTLQKPIYTLQKQ